MEGYIRDRRLAARQSRKRADHCRIKIVSKPRLCKTARICPLDSRDGGRLPGCGQKPRRPSPTMGRDRMTAPPTSVAPAEQVDERAKMGFGDDIPAEIGELLVNTLQRHFW